MVKVCFWDNCLCERGTTVSLYDYAYYNQTLLGNESIVMYNTTRKENNDTVIEKFRKHFKVIGVDQFSKVDPILLSEKCDVFYIIKSGANEGQVSHVAKTVVHCVFDCNSPHGNVYSSIAPWVNGNNGRFPVVPHMINLPKHDDNMRAELGIPESAVVFGGFGGSENFSIPFAQQIVYDIAKSNPNIYFLFANFIRFCPDLPNIIHLEAKIDLYEKVKFINTTDAMLWARSGGEVMSLAMGEFAVLNKPIICMNIGYPGHVHLLGEKAIWYSDENGLRNILLEFNPEVARTRDWNAYADYTPEKVMEIFKNVYLSD
jgi:hypothetical protein